VDPLNLPVYQQRDRILSALADHPVIVVESPTGSGKTTQIPRILLEAGYADSRIVGVTQPRRIAAVSVAEFIARQLGKQIPDTVGYKMRFEDRTDPRTRIKIMTDGILLQEIKADRLLARYSVMMVDEAHERSLNIDFILGLLRRVLEERPEFKVIVSSATINAEVFSEYFDGCPVVNIDTPMYPVQVLHEPPRSEGSPEALQEKIVQIVTATVERRLQSEERHDEPPEERGRRRGKPRKRQTPALDEAAGPGGAPHGATAGESPAPHGAPPGDILIFLSGEGPIKNCMAALQSLPFSGRLEVLPLYSRLSSEEQERVFLDYPGKIKVIVATNIAETSVTIDGVTTVIDSGLAKMNYYNQRNFTSSLIEVPISKAAANQRKGRAGRTQPGVCYRLYSRKDFDLRSLFTTEEILRTDLSEVVLRMADLGIRNFEDFDFLARPSREGIVSAIETLRLLDALDQNREVTPIGAQILQFPILPRLGRMIAEAVRSYPTVIHEVLIAAAFLSTHSPFLLPPGEEMEARRAHHGFRDPLGDFVSYLKLFRAFRGARDREGFCRRYYLDLKTLSEIVNIEGQLEEILAQQGIPVSAGGDPADYLCAVARGLIQFVCARSGRGVYRSLTANRIQIHPGSGMFREDPQYIVAGEIVRTSRMWAHSVSPLRRAWLARISPQLAERLAGAAGGRASREAEREAEREREAEPAAPRERPVERGRDTTHFVKIGLEMFDVRVEKGKKKTVLLPWEKIRRVALERDVLPLPNYNKLRAKVLYEGYELLSGMRLSTILKVLPHIEMERGIVEELPEGTLELPDGYPRLQKLLPDVLKPCRLRKAQRRLGFLALHTDGQGRYWFQGARNYVTALNETLFALETLADAAPEQAPSHSVHDEINRLYRQLSARLEEL
jgi:HrpA-like RNA helicase